jgi:hypothetical protein
MSSAVINGESKHKQAREADEAVSNVGNCLLKALVDGEIVYQAK